MAFEKIETVGRIKGFARTNDGVKAAFKEAFFTDAAIGPLSNWLDGETDVKITIETFAENLPQKDVGPALTDE